jgi:hypothetical protein
MVDFVQGSAPQPWSKQVVLKAAEAIAPFQPAFIEEPFTIEDKRAHRELRQRGTWRWRIQTQQRQIFCPTPGAFTMTPDQVIALCRAGEKLGAKEALFSLGDKPEALFPEHRAFLR